MLVARRDGPIVKIDKKRNYVSYKYNFANVIKIIKQTEELDGEYEIINYDTKQDIGSRNN